MADLWSALKGFNVLRTLGQWARSRFARQPPWRAFVGWEAYYAAYLRAEPGHALIQHTGTYVGDAARQIELINGMVAGRGPAIVWAPPGCGKSRFALELARRIERARGRWQVVFVRHDETVVREELHQLTQLKRVVFIVDDAHECPELVKLLAGACVQASPAAPLHLVCITRSTGRAQVTRAINGVFPPGAVQEIDLGRPSTQLVRTLIDQLLPKSSPHHRDTIARFVRQSYFGAVLVCTLLSRERKLPQTFQRQDLRDRVCREPLREAVEGVCPTETAVRVLAVYSALAPVPKASAEVQEAAVQLSGLAPATVEILIGRVLQAGLFQEYGRALLRPIPDLLGDLILEEACLDEKGRPNPFSTQLLERLFELDPVRTVANCADIGQLFGTSEEVDLVSALVLSRARLVPAENKWDVIKLLQTCDPLTSRRPGTVLEVAKLLEARGILRRNPPAQELFGIDSIEMSTCALLMRAGEVDPTVVPVALQLGRDLYGAARGDLRSQQHVLETLQAYCRFEIGRSVAHARAVVNTLRTWVSESDLRAAALAASLSAQFLTLEVEGQHEADDSVTLLRSVLSPSTEVWAVRDVAVDTLLRGMSRPEATVQCTAVGPLERYAEHQGAAVQTWSESWKAQLAREVERLSGAIVQIPQASQSLPVLAVVERHGWHWWSQESDLLHRAGKGILASMPSTDAYELWKLLHSQTLPVSTTVPSDTVQAQERLKYFQELSRIREEDTAKQARQLLDTLDIRYTDLGAWRSLWLTVFDQSPGAPLQHDAGAVIGEFARRHPDVAWSFVNPSDAEGPLFAMLTFLLVELGKQDRARRSQEASRVPPGTRLEEAWLRALWSAQDLDEPESILLARGLESTDAATVRRAAGALMTASSADRGASFRRVFATIARHPTDTELWDLALERFVLWAEGVLLPRASPPTEAMAGVADDLATLMQTYGSQLRWGFQQHTRQLANVFAILAVICPQRLQKWMQRTWGQPARPGSSWDDESPLAVGRLAEIMRLIEDSPAATQWIETFSDWMRHDPGLGAIAALGLAELCSLDDARVGELAYAIGTQPTDTSLKAFAEFIHHQKSDRAFAEKAIALLEVWTRFPDSYARIENAVIHVFVYGASGRTLGRPSPAHERALKAIDARRAQGTTSGLLLASLEHAEREVRAAMANNVAQDEEFADP